ncbi:MAG: hypothetical protein HZB43_02600 [candidate division Zixibacteria bacterium]|nr:hypothetical protein [candidate division Zixibacteria bacterium]
MMTSAIHSAEQTITAGAIQTEFAELLRRAQSERLAERIGAGEASVWSSDPAIRELVSDRLGWLNVASAMQLNLGDIEHFAEGVFADGVRDVVLLGMGGSSLCPAVFGQIFRRLPGRGKFLVLDLTSPSAVKRIERQIDIANCLFVSASKSGKTVETRSHTEYFWEKVTRAVGSRAKERFVAITDKGSALEQLGRAKSFRRVFLNPSDIGGRYSALSYFGLVPGALAGVPLRPLLECAVSAQSAGLDSDASNSAVELGLLIGGAAKAGRDKLTFMAASVLGPLVPWIEQLIAESTGKNQTGIIPIENEPLANAEQYGPDRAFVFFRMEGKPDLHEGLRSQLIRLGHPVVEISVADTTQIGGEFFRWELATAVAGWVLGVNPFDEPNVQESKDNTQRVLADLVSGKAVAQPHGVASGEGFSILSVSPGTLSSQGDARGIMRGWLDEARQCGYISILAFMDDTAENEAVLGSMRRFLGQQTGRATLRGYGPRYLHSIGQLYKGGPQTGAFLVISSDESSDVRIPGADYSFSMLKMAQAMGDAESLVTRGRPLVHVHLTKDQAGLENLAAMLTS